MNLTAKNTLTTEGAQIAAQGDINIDATDINVKTAKNEKTVDIKSNTNSVGFFTESTNKTGADAVARGQAKADAAANIDPNDPTKSTGRVDETKVSGEATATVNASSNNNVDFEKNTRTETTSRDVKNIGSTIAAGGKLNITAKNRLDVQGSELSGEKHVTVKAKDMSFTAAQDESVTTTRTETTRAGIYADAGVTAGVGAKANAEYEGRDAKFDNTSEGRKAAAEEYAKSRLLGNDSQKPQTEAQAGAIGGGRASAGVQVRNNSSATTTGSSTAVTSMIRSGSGSVTRAAEGKITDQARASRPPEM